MRQLCVVLAVLVLCWPCYAQTPTPTLKLQACGAFNVNTGCKAARTVWTPGSVPVADDGYNATWQAPPVASGLVCAQCVDGSDVANPFTCADSYQQFSCEVRIADQNTALSNGIDYNPNNSVSGGVPTPVAGHMFCGDCDNRSGDPNTDYCCMLNDGTAKYLSRQVQVTDGAQLTGRSDGQLTTGYFPVTYSDGNVGDSWLYTDPTGAALVLGDLNGFANLAGYPTASINIVQQNSYGGVTIYDYSGYPAFSIIRVCGTLSAKEACTSTQGTGGFGFGAWDGEQGFPTSEFNGYLSEDCTPSACGGVGYLAGSLNGTHTREQMIRWGGPYNGIDIPAGRGLSCDHCIDPNDVVTFTGSGSFVLATGPTISLDSASTAATASADDNDTSLATTAFVQQEINGSGGAGLACTSGSCATASTEAAFIATNAGAPASGDCDADGERGKMVLDHTNHVLYICDGASRGWDHVDMVD